MSGIRFTLPREERLKSVREISGLFEKGRAFLCYPIKVVWVEVPPGYEYPIQVAFSVSKKNFKKAAERNKLKRKMKEAYRLNRLKAAEQLKGHSLNCMFIYIAREILPYSVIEKGMRDALYKITRLKSAFPES